MQLHARIWKGPFLGDSWIFITSTMYIPLSFVWSEYLSLIILIDFYFFFHTKSLMHNITLESNMNIQ